MLGDLFWDAHCKVSTLGAPAVAAVLIVPEHWLSELPWGLLQWPTCARSFLNWRQKCYKKKSASRRCMQACACDLQPISSKSLTAWDQRQNPFPRRWRWPLRATRQMCQTPIHPSCCPSQKGRSGWSLFPAHPVHTPAHPTSLSGTHYFFRCILTFLYSASFLHFLKC